MSTSVNLTWSCFADVRLPFARLTCRRRHCIGDSVIANKSVHVLHRYLEKTYRCILQKQQALCIAMRPQSKHQAPRKSARRVFNLWYRMLVVIASSLIPSSCPSRGRIILRSPQLLRILFTHFLALSDIHPPRHSLSLVSNPSLEYTLSVALTDLLSSQILESWPKRPVHIVILAKEAILSGITEWVELIAPMTTEVKPAYRHAGIEVRREEAVGLIVVGE